MSLDGGGERRGPAKSGRLVIAAIIALISIISYFSSRSTNPVTHEVQHIKISPQQEIALGLQAAPEMVRQYGGEVRDARKSGRAKRIGQEIVASALPGEIPYKFDFHVLDDPKTLNAFALPGGQVFVTDGLLSKLSTDGQVAAVLGHEIGHVVARHSAEQMAKAQLTEGLTGAAVIATYDPNDSRSRNSAAVAAMIGQLVNLKFSRGDESEADKLGVRFVAKSGYDPHAMLKVMEILRDASKGQHTPEFFSTHPNPENRLERIQQNIKDEFPNGLPPNLKG